MITNIFNKGTLVPYKFETICSFGDPKIYDHIIYGHTNSFNEIWHTFFMDKSILAGHDKGGFETLRLRSKHESLIVTTLLDYEHLFIGNLHKMDSRSWAWFLYLNLIL